MQQTTNYNLKKIELTDSPPDITVINPNWDTIDTAIKAVDNSLVEHKADITSFAEFGITLDQSIPNDIYTKIMLDRIRKSKDYCVIDNGAVKFTKPGTYQITTNIPIRGGVIGIRTIKVLKNTTAISEDYKMPTTSNTVLQSNIMVEVNANDTIEIQIKQDNGSSLTVVNFVSLMYLQVKKVG